MFDRGRHDRHTARHQASRYHLRQGMAKLALKTKVDGQPMVDTAGRPFLYCNEMAERHNTKTIEKWARGVKTLAVQGGMEFCPQCHRVPKACRCQCRHG